MSVGNDLIDQDHQALIDIINRAEHSVVTGNSHELTGILKAMSDYAREHFAREEAIASAVGYVHFGQLSHSHQTWIKSLDKISSEVGEMGQEWPSAKIDHFTNLLRHWLIDHVIHEDMLLKPALKKFPANFVAK